MTQRFIINARVEFCPDEHRLVTLSAENKITELNVPTSQCLALLIERRYTLVPQHDFYTYVWGDEGVTVSINTLYQNLSLLRRALRTADEGLDNMVVTVPKQGFKLNEAFSIVSIPDEEDQQGEPPEVSHPASLWEERQPGDGEPPLQRRPQEEQAIPVHEGETQPPSSRYSPPLRWLPDKLLVYLVVGLFLLSALLLYSFGLVLPQPSYFSDYTRKDQEGGCVFYTRPMIEDWNSKKALIKTLQLDCKLKPYLYITTYNVNAQLSFFACDEMMGMGRKQNCTYYSMMNEKT